MTEELLAGARWASVSLATAMQVRRMFPLVDDPLMLVGSVLHYVGRGFGIDPNKKANDND